MFTFSSSDFPISAPQVNAAEAVGSTCERNHTESEILTVTPVHEVSHHDTQIFADSEVAIGNINTAGHQTDDTHISADIFLHDFGEIEREDNLLYGDADEGVKSVAVINVQPDFDSNTFVEDSMNCLCSTPEIQLSVVPVLHGSITRAGIGKQVLPPIPGKLKRRKQKRSNKRKKIKSLSKKVRIQNMIKELSVQYPKMSHKSKNYRHIAKLVINTIIKNKGDVEDYIDLTNEPDEVDQVIPTIAIQDFEKEYKCLRSECICQMHCLEDFERKGFHISYLPVGKFDSSYVPKIVQNSASDINLNSFRAVNFGPTEESYTRYMCRWDELPDMDDKKYVNTILFLVESYVKSFVGDRRHLGECETNAKEDIFRDSVVILSLPNGVAQSRHTDQPSAAHGLSILIALDEDTALDVIPGSHRSMEWIHQFETENNMFNRVEIPKHHFLVFSGGLHHRGVSYPNKNVRLHSYVDFVGNTRQHNTVYNMKELELLREERELEVNRGHSNVVKRRISRILPMRRQMRLGKNN